MIYSLRFFTHDKSEEKFIKEYNFNSMPFIPRIKDLICLENDQYFVRKVSIDYEDENEMLFEIMTDKLDYNKDWWE